VKVLSVAVVATVTLVVAGAALAHVRISPPVALAEATQVFTLVVPTESETADTTKVVLTVPEGFRFGAAVPSSGWSVDVEQTGSGEDAVVSKVTWNGGKIGPGEVGFLQFSGRSTGSETYAFPVEQTYSDGTIANWSGPESADEPAPTVEMRSSFGGGGSSLLAVIALAVGAVGVLLGGIALVSRGGGRPLA
jgi:uncharacterized protein YcnI